MSPDQKFFLDWFGRVAHVLTFKPCPFNRRDLLRDIEWPLWKPLPSVD